MPFQPDQASTIAAGVDDLYYFLTALTLFFTALIFLSIFYFVVKYRRRSEDERPPQIQGSRLLEIVWSVIPAGLTLLIFVWGAGLYFKNARPPRESTEIFAIGKQWMWQVQHPEGPREINELHVPVNVPVKITLTSEDVIHDFFIPAFRVKKDALPGRYTSFWFQATKTGTYHFFCAQYCGAEHAGMIGWVYVMSASDYTQWLSGGSSGETMETKGARLFSQLGCATCHAADGSGRGPSFVNLYGKPVRLIDGRTPIVDDAYIRGCILNPFQQIVAGYPPLMPTYKGQVSEEQILQLIAYIKSLSSVGGNKLQ